MVVDETIVQICLSRWPPLNRTVAWPQSKSQNDWATDSQGWWNPVAHTTYTNSYQYSASHPHRVTQVGAQTFGFDLNGNQVTSQGGTEPTRLMQWDEDDRLTSVIQDNKQVTFRYDASGTRTHRSSTNGVFQYANQWYSVRNGSLATKHIFAGGTRVASVIGEGSNELRVFYHSDHLGSTQLVTNASGQVREHYEQIPFGEPWIEEVAQTDNNAVHRFTGKELDPETGMYYFGARYYEPRLSQWISVDPALGMSLEPRYRWGYTYVSNSPIRLIDPDGRDGYEFFMGFDRWIQSFHQEDYFIPIVGQFAGMYNSTRSAERVVLGQDPVVGRPLTTEERCLEAGAVVLQFLLHRASTPHTGSHPQPNQSVGHPGASRPTTIPNGSNTIHIRAPTPRRLIVGGARNSTAHPPQPGDIIVNPSRAQGVHDFSLGDIRAYVQDLPAGTVFPEVVIENVSLIGANNQAQQVFHASAQATEVGGHLTIVDGGGHFTPHVEAATSGSNPMFGNMRTTTHNGVTAVTITRLR